MTFNECLKTLTASDITQTKRHQAKAKDRLFEAQREVKTASVYRRGDVGPAIQELSFAMAVAEEWGVIGRKGGAR